MSSQHQTVFLHYSNAFIRYLGDLRLDVAAVSSIVSRKTYKCTIQVTPSTQFCHVALHAIISTVHSRIPPSICQQMQPIFTPIHVTRHTCVVEAAGCQSMGSSGTMPRQASCIIFCKLQNRYTITDDVQLFLAANCNWVAADFNAAPHFAFGDGSFDLVILREHNSSRSGSKVAAGRWCWVVTIWHIMK